MEDTQIRRRVSAPDQEIRPHRCIGILRESPDESVGGHGADIGIELAEASAPLDPSEGFDDIRHLRLQQKLAGDALLSFVKQCEFDALVQIRPRKSLTAIS